MRASDGGSLGLDSLDLSKLGPGWHTFLTTTGLPTDKVVLSLEATGPGQGVPELELWALAERERTRGDLREAKLPGGFVGIPATGSTSELVPGACGDFSSELVRSPSQFARAHLVLEAEGIAGPFALRRTINGGGAQGGAWLGGRAVRTFVEEIDPGLLALGTNTVRLCLPAAATHGATIHSLRIVGALARGTDLIAGITVGARDASGVLEGQALEVGAGEHVAIALERLIAPDAIVFEGTVNGTPKVACIGRRGANMPLAVTRRVLADRTVLRVDGGAHTCASLDVAFANAAKLTALDVTGSGAAERVDWPRLVVTSAPEHFGDKAWVGGFVAKPPVMTGAVRVAFDGTLADELTGDFGRLVTRELDAGPWSVQLEGRFPDGSKAQQTVVLDRSAATAGTNARSGTAAATPATAAQLSSEGDSVVVRASPGSASQLRLGVAAGLDIPAGAVLRHTPITARHLGTDVLPPLDPGMINVTAPRGHGYEFLPHGQKFARPVEVIVPFDPSLIPEGMTADDVYTYFYDPDAERWKRLERVAVDLGKRVTRSKTDHFTIMIDAVLAVPKNPSPLSFDPTTLTSVAAATPAANMDLIEPPQASPTGEARMALPIRSPMARGKYSPALSIGYSSGGESSWLGVGWNLLGTSAIEIDTRWGVPTYAADEEPRYLLDGAALVPTQETDGPRCQDGRPGRRYRARTEGAFAHILRCELAPGGQFVAHYFEVRDRDGTLFVYGADSLSDTSGASVASYRDARHVFRWNLARVIDVHGNTSRFSYDHDDLTDTAEPSREVYLASIAYTSHPLKPAAYTLELERDDGTRPDRIVSGRAGFKMVTRHLLRAVHVKFRGETITSYVLTYARGAFDRSVLASIRQYGLGGCTAGGNAFALASCAGEHREHRIEVFGEETRFAAPVTWNVSGDPRPAAAALGRGETRASSFGVSLNVGEATGTGPSLSASIGTQKGERGERIGFYDVDSDGKADQILDIPATRFLGQGPPDDAGIHVLYNHGRPGFEGLDPNADPLLAKSDERTVTGLPGLGIERFRGSSIDAGLSSSSSGLGGSLSAGFGNTTTRARRVVGDANGDGHMDLIDASGVALIGAPCPTGTCFTEQPFGVAGSVDPKRDNWLQQLATDEADQTIVADPVVQWTAPFDGRVVVTGTARKQASGGNDGVSVEVFHQDTFIEGITIGPGETAPLTFPASTEIDVIAGQAIYLRVRTGDDVGLEGDVLADKVDARLDVRYLRACTSSGGCEDVVDPFAAREPTGAAVFAYDSQTDFRLAGQPAVLPIFAGGTLRLQAQVEKRPSLADVRLCVQKLTSTPESAPRLDVPCDTTTTDVENVAPTVVLPADSTVTHPIDLTFGVAAGQLIVVRAEADLSFDPADVRLAHVDGTRPFAEYTEACLPNDDATDFECFTDPEVLGDVPLLTEFFGVFVPVSVQVPALPFVAPGDDLLDLDPFSGPGEPFVFAVRSDRQGILWLSDCKAASCAEIDVPPLAVTTGESVTLELAVDGSVLVPSHLTGTFGGASTSFPLTRRALSPDPAPRTPFAGGYRGFRAMAWNDDEPFEPARLLADLAVFSLLGEERRQQIQRTIITPLPSFEATPITLAPAWVAPGAATFVSATTLHAGPIGAEVTDDPELLADFVRGLFAKNYLRLSGSRSSYIGGSFGLKGAPFNFGFGVTVSQSETKTTTDVVDLTGDGVPEVIAREVKLGKLDIAPDGGGTTGHVIEDALRVRKGTEFTIKLDGGVQRKTTAGGRSTEIYSKDGVDRGRLGFSGGVGLGIGRSQTTRDLVDLNGDGLPDLVRRQGPTIHVRYNLGHRFGEEEPFGTVNADLRVAIDNFEDNHERTSTELPLDSTSNALSHETTISRHKEAGFGAVVVNVSQSARQSSSRTTRQLADINGDGRPDLLVKRDDERFIRVQINRGADFGPAMEWPIGRFSDGQSWPLDLPQIEDSRLVPFELAGPDVLASTTSSGRSSSGSILIPVTPNVGVGASLSKSKDSDSYEVALVDIDGDAIADHVLRHSTLCPPRPCTFCPPPPCTPESHVYVKRNQVSGKGNLVRAIHNPLGGTIRIDYARTDTSVDLPQSRLVLSQIEVDDGVDLGPAFASPTVVTRIAYEDGFFHRGEKEFFGFAKVTTTRADGVSVEQVFENRSYPLRGSLMREIRKDGSGALFAERAIAHDVLAVRGEGDVPLSFDPACIANLHPLLGPDACLPLHPVVSREESIHAEGGAERKVRTMRDTARDRFGNVLASIDEVDDAIASDDVHATATYQNDTTRWILGRATQLTVRAGAAGELLRARTGEHGANGELVRVHVNTGTGTATTQIDRDVFGNVSRITTPPNAAGQPQTYDLTYDPDVATYPASVTDGFGYRSTAVYDVRFGVATLDVDTNGAPLARTLDGFGRLASVRGPYDTSAPALEMTYVTDASPARAITVTRTSAPPDYTGPVPAPITTLTVVDGLGRPVELRKTAVVDGTLGMTTSGLVQRDAIGREIKTYQPFFTPGASTEFVNSPPVTFATEHAYDALDRPILTRFPDGATERAEHFLASDPATGALLLATRAIDPNGHARETYTDLAGRTRTFVEHPTSTTSSTTRYDYRATGELVRIVDAEDNVTQLRYDLRGLRTSLANPDTGLIEDRYDLMGNQIALVEPNHRALGVEVAFQYDRDRLAAIDYPSKPDVTFVYGTPGDTTAFRAGRLAEVHDETGSQQHFYGALGEVRRTIRAVDPGQPGRAPITFDLRFVTDSLGRQLQLRYPDGEVLTNHYDAGGMLARVDAAGDGWSRTYAADLRYDVFGNRTQLRAGNGVVTTWAFEPERVRLSRITSTLPSSPSKHIQDLHYKYDSASNPIEITNTLATLTGGSGNMPGESSVTLTYDGVDRLVRSVGSAQLTHQKRTSYDQTFAYSASHNLLHKQRVHLITQPSGIPAAPTATNFSSAYLYADRPHLPAQIGDLLVTYDPSGNPTSRKKLGSGAEQTLVWDDDGRLVNVTSSGANQLNRYDASGRRVLRRSVQSETIFASSYFDLENGTQSVKHVFAGEVRVASALGKFDGGVDPSPPVKQSIVYFFHADHLGSTGVLTTEDASVHQSLEYFSDGEIWIDRAPQKPVNGYLFNGKPLDADTGFYDFGQRFYDPRTSVWLGIDPAIVTNLSPSQNLPSSLSVVGFASWNPIRHIDPDGRDPVEFQYDPWNGSLESQQAKYRAALIQSWARQIPDDLPNRAIMLDGTPETWQRAKIHAVAGAIGLSFVCPTCVRVAAGIAITQARNEGEALTAAVGGWLAGLWGRARGAGHLGQTLQGSAKPTPTNSYEAIGGGPGAAALKPSIRMRLREAGLPGGTHSVGPFKFIPKRGYKPGNPLPQTPKGGYIDRFENVWERGPYHGDPKLAHTREWDVQLSAAGRAFFKRKGVDVSKGYVNITPSGWLSH